jgi:hypothetical protein
VFQLIASTMCGASATRARPSASASGMYSKL